MTPLRYLTCLSFILSELLLGNTGPSPPFQGFFLVTNNPERGRGSEGTYIHGINTDTIHPEDELELSKETGLPSDAFKTGNIEVEGVPWGCYLFVGRPNLGRGIIYGTYSGMFTYNFGLVIPTRYTYIKPRTRYLDTRGVYTVTFYPVSDGSTALDPNPGNPIGVAWSPGCQRITWCKGKKRNINTGPRFEVTSTEDAGVYTIQRGSRGKRGLAVQIQVIVADCPRGWYMQGESRSCQPRVTSATCLNGGVARNGNDQCTCPPYYSGVTCGGYVLEVGFPYLGVPRRGPPLTCDDLPGGNPKCRGHLFCFGDLYGCKCAPGWFGNNCDQPCRKGTWIADCEQKCLPDIKDCDRFLGLRAVAPPPSMG